MKLLDNFSKVLVAISIVGIGIGLYLLFFFKNTGDTRDSANKVATITQSNNDTRLKRSGNIHWFPVNQNIDAFDDDVIFTGKNSLAKVKFKNGGEITLHPMSLITISNGNVTLNSGTIDVNLERGSLKVESFGEEFHIKEKTSFKVQNTKEAKRVIPIANPEALAKIPSVKNYIQTQNISIVAPMTGAQLPKFKGSSLNLRWKASTVNANSSFKVEFSPSETFDSISFATETPFTNLKLPAETLPAGLNYMRVRDTKNEAKAESSFFLLDDVKIEYLQPSNLADYPLDQVESQGVLFEWTNSLSYPQKLQISRTADFQNLLQDETLEATRATHSFAEEGKYFWRVGHVLDKVVYWGDTATFSLSKKIPVSPLEIHAFAKVMDFRLTPQYVINVHDLNKCEEFEFTLLRGNQVVSKIKTAKPGLKISRLNDGNYQVKVVGRLKNNVFTEPVVRDFSVKNSAPLKAPRINKKKVKLFVKLMKEALDFVFPSAHAQAPTAFYNLEWEETPGAVYEIEIAKSTKDNIVIREKVDAPKYKFIVPGPETFYWRVRSHMNNEWSPFSEFAEVQVLDRIRRISDALMTEPQDGETVELSKEEPTIEFKWDEPDKRATYFLELSTRVDGSNSKVIKVKDGSHKISFKKTPKQIYWRVFAESKFKNRTQNNEFFRVATAKEKEKEKVEKKPEAIAKDGKFIVRGAAYFAQSANIMDFSSVDLDKRDETLTGPVFEFNGEYLPGRWNHRKSINAYFRYTLLSSSETELSEKKLGAEFGWLSPTESETKHNFYAGVHFFDSMSFKFGSDITGNYNLMFVSGRYVYRKPLSEKINFELNSGLQLPNLGFNPLVILRPGINYKWTEKLWLDTYVLFERFTHELKDTKEDNNVKIQYQNIGLGLGFTYFVN